MFICISTIGVADALSCLFFATVRLFAAVAVKFLCAKEIVMSFSQKQLENITCVMPFLASNAALFTLFLLQHFASSHFLFSVMLLT